MGGAAEWAGLAGQGAPGPAFSADYKLHACFFFCFVLFFFCFVCLFVDVGSEIKLGSLYPQPSDFIFNSLELHSVPTMAIPFCIPSTMHKGSSFLIASSKLLFGGFWWVLSHLDRELWVISSLLYCPT